MQNNVNRKKVDVYLNGERVSVFQEEFQDWKDQGKRFYYIKEQRLYIPVTEAFYRGFMPSEWREDKREERDKRCVVAGKRCHDDCNFCQEIKRAAFSWDKLEEDVGEPVIVPGDVAECCIAELINRELYEALDELTPEDKKIIEMLLDELPEREIAAEVGLSQTGVNKRKRRLFKILRTRLEKYI